MDLEPMEFGGAVLPVPPSYEQCVAKAVGPRADYVVVSPRAMAALFDWDDDEYDL